jgi:serine/threonine protein kinase
MTDQPTPKDSSVDLPPTVSSEAGSLLPTVSSEAGPVPPTVDDKPKNISQVDSGPTQDLSCTGDAPSFHAPVPSQKKGRLGAGDRIDDFEIISVLGAGAFATVYLAREIPLDRQVALKVSANRGTEARTLAILEHEHIVRVFYEKVRAQHDQRLLCMQYVNGATLAKVIDGLAKRAPETWSGRAILEVIDDVSTRPAMFDPAALRDRELLWNADYVDAVAWIGARLAEALAHAHHQGVLHRDIKPANILLNRYGRPMLADFNISFDPRPVQGSARAMFGGTLGYMAPEHLDAFNPLENTPREAVDQRSDIYSLGVVLFEMLVGEMPFPEPHMAPTGQTLRELAAERRTGAPKLPPERAVPEALDRVVRRCLAPASDERYQSAGELARVLEGCREYREVDKDLPRGGLLTEAVVRHPFAWGLVLLMLPHLLGSIVNISYNALEIVHQLSPAQQAVFGNLVLVYNLLVYPAAVILMIQLIAPIWRTWGRLQRGEMVPAQEVNSVRKRVLQLPVWAIVLSCAGWLPGGLLFPLGLHLFSGPCPPSVFGHFLVSFTISGLIALTYSVFAIQYVALRAFYPRLWIDAHSLRRHAREELGGVLRRLYPLQLLAGTIPLAGAILMMAVPLEEFTAGYRLLVMALILLGMLGIGVAVFISGRLAQTVTALTGGARSAATSEAPSPSLAPSKAGSQSSPSSGKDKC